MALDEWMFVSNEIFKQNELNIALKERKEISQFPFTILFNLFRYYEVMYINSDRAIGLMSTVFTNDPRD